LLTPVYRPPINILRDNNFLGYGFNENDYNQKIDAIGKWEY